MFRAYEPDLDKLVAVKLFDLSLPPDQVHRLSAELDVLVQADLSHPAIASPIATGITGVAAYLAQDFVSADALEGVTGDHRRTTPSEAVRIVTQLAAAFDFSATKDVYHGAFHTRDVLVSPDEVRLTGLGIAQALERIGVTPPVRRPFTAPEQAAGEAWNQRADVFALVVLAHELLWGKRVTSMGDEAAIALTELPGGDLDLLRGAFARGLAADPKTRFERASAFAEELAVAFSELVTEDEGERPEPSLPLAPAVGQLPLDADELPELELRGSGPTESAVKLSPTPEELKAFAAEQPLEAEQGTEATSFGLADEEDTGGVPSYPSSTDESDASADEAGPELEPFQPAVFISPEEARSILWPVVFAAMVFAVMGFVAGHAVATLGGLVLFGGASLEPPALERASPSQTAPMAPVQDREPVGEPVEPQPVGERPVALPPQVDEPRIEPEATAPPVAPPSPVVPARPGAPEPGPPSLTVESRPPGAAVFVDGRQIGRTPLVTDTVAVGEYVIRLELDGYQDWTTTVGIAAGPNRIAASLQP